MVQGVSHLGYLYTIPYKAIQQMGSLTTHVSSKVVTIVSTTVHQVASLIYRICKAAYRAIAYASTWLFGKSINAEILKQIDEEWSNLIASVRPSLELYIPKDADVRFEVSRRCSEYRLSSRTHLIEYFEVAFNIDEREYSSLVRIAAEKRSGSVQPGREKPFNLQIVLEYLTDDQKKPAHVLSRKLLTDIKFQLIKHPSCCVILCNPHRKHLLHIHTKESSQDVCNQTWTFHTAEENVSVDVELRHGGWGGSHFNIFSHSVRTT